MSLITLKNGTFFFAVPKNAKEAIYYLVAVKKQASLEDLKVVSEKGFNEIYLELKKKTENWKDFEKNTTFIICYDGPQENIKDIWKIAKDAYGFKKNILFFDAEEEKEFSNLVCGNNSNKHLNTLLNKPDSFKKLKDDNVEKGYGLLIKLFTCLPFLTYMPEQKQIGNLEKQIQNELEKENLLTLATHILEKIDIPDSIDDDFTDNLLKELVNEI